MTSRHWKHYQCGRTTKGEPATGYTFRADLAPLGSRLLVVQTSKDRVDSTWLSYADHRPGRAMGKNTSGQAAKAGLGIPGVLEALLAAGGELGNAGPIGEAWEPCRRSDLP